MVRHRRHPSVSTAVVGQPDELSRAQRVRVRLGTGIEPAENDKTITVRRQPLDEQAKRKFRRDCAIADPVGKVAVNA